MKVSIVYLIKTREKLDKDLIQNWIQDIVESENKKLGKINIILSTDKHLLDLNQRFLGHNYFTDVIAFGTNRKNIINGEVFISYERIGINAINYQEEFARELYRVIAHGVLHLIGFNDKSKRDKEIMTEKEDTYMSKGKMK